MQTDTVTLWKVFENSVTAPMAERYNGTSREAAVRAFEACKHGFFMGQVYDGRTYTQVESAHK